MIKKFTLCALAVLALASCTTLQPAAPTGGAASSSSSQGSQGLLGSLLSGLIGSAVPVTEKNLAGTWHYSSPECRFTSENALAQAGGAVAASTVEGKLAEAYGKLGISPSSCSFTFNEDKTCSITLGGRSINGRYTLDSQSRTLNITSNTGLIKLNATVYYDLNSLTLLFDAQKLLSVAQMLSAFTGQGNSTLGALSSMLNSYEGMLIGMNLKK